MAIRLLRGLKDEDGSLSPTLWSAQRAMNLPVGRCDCGESALGEPIDWRGHVGYATLVCSGCGVIAGAVLHKEPVAA